MLKRSRQVTPAILGSVMSLTLMTGCGEPQEDATVVQNIEQCVAAGQYTQVECQLFYDQAKAQHQEVAPQFESKEDCEAEFGVGNCEALGGGSTTTDAGFSQTTVVHHHSNFVPVMAGVMIGQAISQPLYRPYHNGSYGAFMTNRGMPVSTVIGRQKIAQSIVTSRPLRTTSTLKRGGFGAMSRSTISS